MKEYDIMVVGPVSLDHNIDYLGNERKEVGGAVVASGFAAAGSGAKTAIFCKSNAADADVKERFAGVNADLYWAASKATCSIRNQYFTADKEKRACTSMGVCDPFRFEELPQVKTKVYHFAGLVYGDFDGALLAEAAKHGKVGLDVQCMLRHVEPDKSMAFHDWAEKKELLPLMDYFKTDAAVRRALGQEAADATVIVVAQRIATVMHADEILVLDEGRLAGKGTHAELMESCEVYRQIAVSQLSKEELAHGTK
mgnify:CR=1 FL=1